MHSMDSFCLTQVINYWSSISLNTAHQSYSSIRSCSALNLMLECLKNFTHEVPLHYGHGYLHACSVRAYVTALLEYINFEKGSCYLVSQWLGLCPQTLASVT